MNKMTAANLAVVFGPNLVWSNDKTMSLTSIGKVGFGKENIIGTGSCFYSALSIEFFSPDFDAWWRGGWMTE